MNKKNQDLASNRRALHDYQILETFEAGIALLGSEVKSLRNHSASLQDAYITIRNEELWLINSSISPYAYGGAFNHEERRDRKLLMHKREIAKLKKMSQERGTILIPLSFYLKNGKIKVRIAFAKGKKKYDKRAAIKEKEEKKAIQKALKSRSNEYS